MTDPALIESRAREVEYQRRIAELEQEVEDWRQRHAGQQVRLAQLNHELSLVFATRSWRLTAPLRFVQERLARSPGRVKIQALVLARRLLPKPVKDAILSLVVPQEPAPPATLFAPPVPVTRQVVEQAPWSAGVPIVSVVIPCHNYGRFVEEAVDSVLAQELQSCEVIVVDDGSTDPETIQVLDDLRRERTAVVRQQNMGLSEARNTGIRRARGKYICCLDADDTLEPTYLEKAVSALEANPGIGFVYPWVQLFGDRDQVWRTEPFDLQRLLRYNHVAVAAVFKRGDWERVGGYAADMRLGFEDWEFWLRLGSGGVRGHLIPEALVQQRRHGRTMTAEAEARQVEIRASIRQKYQTLYEDSEAVARVEATFADVRVRDPFANLADAAGYRATNKNLLVVLLPWLPAGGAEAVVLQMMTGLRERRPVDFAVFTSLPNENEWHERFHDVTHKIYHLPHFLPGYAWQDYLLNFVQTHHPTSILISASEFGYSTLEKLKEEFPELPVYNLLHNDSELGYFRHSVQYDRCIDGHIAVSGAIGKKLRDIGGIPAAKVRVIYNGVDVRRRFNPQCYVDPELRPRWGVPAGRPVVTWIGRLSEEKRPEEFLTMARLLRRTTETDPTFLFVGDGAKREVIAEAIDQLDMGDRLRWFRGLRPEAVAEVLAMTDLVVITSSSEGFPMVMLEALSMSVPVVSYDVGDVRAAIRDGVNGYLVPAADTLGLVDRVGSLLADQVALQRLREQARGSVIDAGFTQEAMLTAYDAVIWQGA